VVHTYNPRYSGGGSRRTESQRPAWAKVARPASKTKTKRARGIAQVRGRGGEERARGRGREREKRRGRERNELFHYVK
jgi:hypothetical protein